MRLRRGRDRQSWARTVWVVAVVVSVAGLRLVVADVGLLRRDAEVMKQKVEAISGRAEAAVPQPYQTIVTEQELNAYLAYELAGGLPPGVVAPALSLLGNSRVEGRALVDFDQVRSAYPPMSLLDPTNYISGRLPMTVIGTVRSANGRGAFEFESASLGGAPVPKLLLQQIVGYYSRSPERPSGLSLDDSFVLPARIQEIRLERGQAIVRQ